MFPTWNFSTQRANDFDIPDISQDKAQILSLFLYAGVCQSFAVFGVVTNIINIVCFVKQGFNEPINISLLGLTISDLCSLVTLMWTCFSVVLIFCSADAPFDVIGVCYLVGARPHLTFTRVTIWITALITLERCLCIIIPLKVKSIITPKRVWIIMVSTYTILLSSEAPIYVVNRLAMAFFPERNTTLYGLVSSNDRERVEMISLSINNFFMPFTACVILITCTIVLVVSLSERSKWRQLSSKASDVNVRNQRVAKMVVMISALFISCFVPVTIIMLAMASIPDLTVGGKYINTIIVVGGFAFIMESINSSANIFIYYHMSSKYRETLRDIFCNNRDNAVVEC